MGTLKDDLAAGSDALLSTHISWVFIRGDDVFKVKKPVDFGFLDFTTLAKRREACEAENTLNTRLTDDVYRGVVPVTRDDDGTHHLDGPGEVVDWAVAMRRLEDEVRADNVLSRGELSMGDVDGVAALIVDFHARCRADATAGAYGTKEAIGRNVVENFEQTRGMVETILRPEDAEEIERSQLRFLDAHEALFARRIETGRVRDGHGDLRLEHVYLPADGRVRIIDCIEFNERFRYADVCADVAFLSMDLAWHGRVDLAERLLATYAQEANDFDLYPLVDFYEGYRAYVRGKIALMLAEGEQTDSAAREQARAEARRYLLLALAAERRSLLPPTLVAVGGPIASGKSTLADRLGAAMGAPSINTDRIRKHMLGATPTTRLYDGSWSGAYDPAFTAQVYDEVERLAKAVLSSGRPVILDASFRSRSMRASARRVADEAGVPFTFVECQVDPEVCRARLRERDMTTSVSDGRLEIFDAFLTKWEPVEELAPGEHVVVDTERPMDEVIESLRARLPLWPENLND